MGTDNRLSANADVIASSRWHPVLGRRLSKFVDHHRQRWDLAMAVLTVLYVVLGLFEDPQRGNAAEVMVWTLSGLFFLEFLLRFLDDSRPLVYLRDHWIDLVTSFPAVGPLRLLRLLRLLRVFNSARMIRRLAADKGDASTTAGLRFLATTVFVFWLLAGYAFYQTELNLPHSTVHSFADALFLAFTTSTTVGYSPMRAVSPEGQIVAGLVIFVGLGLLTAASSRLPLYGSRQPVSRLKTNCSLTSGTSSVHRSRGWPQSRRRWEYVSPSLHRRPYRLRDGRDPSGRLGLRIPKAGPGCRRRPQGWRRGRAATCRRATDGKRSRHRRTLPRFGRPLLA